MKKSKILLIVMTAIAIFLTIFLIAKKNNDEKLPKEPPTFAANSEWYKGKTPKSDITKITIQNTDIDVEYDESWKANEKKTQEIRCYVTNDKELIIAVNGAEKIFANSNSARMFADFTNVLEINGLEILDTSNVTIMEAMFENCNSLKELELDNFNTSNVDNMAKMFSNCNKIGALGLGNFDTGKVTSMASMFNNCEGLKDLDIANFNTISVKNMSRMFLSCNSLKIIDVANFNTDNVTNMLDMFRGCNHLVNLDLSNFNTTKVIKMDRMFTGVYNLETITLGEKFSFKGNGETTCELPVPNVKYIEGADGKWHTKDGISYIPADIPNNVLNTYYAAV